MSRLVAALSLAIFAAQGQSNKTEGPVARASDGKVDLSGVWIVAGSTDLPSDPAYVPAMQKVYEGRKVISGKGDPEKLCLPNGVVRIEPLPYKIVQTPKLVVVLSEGNTHSYRRIFTDGRPHNLELEPNTWNGDSIGRWEGNSLVVDTVGFNDTTWLDSTGKPHSEALHVIERYRRRDLNHLEIGYTLDDPQAFTKAYTFTRTFRRVTDRDLNEYFCAMDNFIGK
jgi:hypothetical protein